MSQNKITKLTLQRETIIPLTPDELDDVNGGTSATVVKTIVEVTKRVCIPVSKNLCVPISQAICPTGKCFGGGGQGQGQ